MKIAIIGGGEVGRAYAEAIIEHGAHQVRVCTPRLKPEVVEAAERSGFQVVTATGPWLAEMDQVWVCVTGDIAATVGVDLIRFMRPTATILDLTTAAPDAKRATAARAEEEGVGYIDAVILGAVAITKIHTPLLAAGPDAAEATRTLAEIGAPVKVLSTARAGDAAALKLLRTILTKGLEGLAVECLTAAERQGVRAELYDAMSDIDTSGFTNFLDMLVTTHIQHCARRLKEVERAEYQLASMGLPASMLGGSQAVFARTVAGRALNPPPASATRDVRAALAWLQETSGPHRERQMT